ncbi:hypothetical protein [Dactylosporangium sp. NPDC005555]|uniref:hypothetical protein n=1 Tax=Dactylosporangium sp. NPDC005555 TaxID=3154889 RepID=UPI00339FC275
MHVFPAEIPAAEARRVDVVEVKVARKVAPLFGLGAELDPFRRSWVCDYTALSLAEIGRGAPFPERAVRARWDANPPGEAMADAGGWAWSGRAVWSPPGTPGTLPGGLSNATLNRYGPDTKAAVVLSAANRLLRGATAAVAEGARFLAETGADAEVRLAVWAGLVLEVYRAQPALVIAAVQARQVQRSLSARWGAQVDPGGLLAGAPCEIHAGTGPADQDRDADGDRWRPTDFNLVDVTLPMLGLASDGPHGLSLVTAEALDDIASAWCHRLLGVGRPGRGVLWLAEDPHGSRQVHAMLRVGAVVAPFVAATLGGIVAGDRAAPPVLPVLPTAEALAAAPLLHRRAQLLVAHVTANYVRYRDEWLLAWPALRTQTRRLVTDATGLADRVLAANDPVVLQLGAYATYLRVWDLPRLPAGHRDAEHRDADGPDPVAALVASQQRLIEAWQSGELDPGTVAYLLEIGLVALTDAARHGSGAAAGDRDVTLQRRCWAVILQARGLTADKVPTVEVGDAQVFHLHHYAAWLASGQQLTDLRRALALQERVVAVRAEVARQEPAVFAAKSAAARAGYELAAQIATKLVLATPGRERGARLRAAQAAAGHARAVLADSSTRVLLAHAGATPAAIHAAVVTARALSVAAVHGARLDAADTAAAFGLIDTVLEASADAQDAEALRGWRAGLVAAVPEAR